MKTWTYSKERKQDSVTPSNIPTPSLCQFIHEGPCAAALEPHQNMSVASILFNLFHSAPFVLLLLWYCFVVFETVSV